PEFDKRSGGAVPALGSPVRAVVVGHFWKQLRVSAHAEHLEHPGQFEAQLFALMRADNGECFKWLPGLAQRQWRPGDRIPWGQSYSLRVVRMIDPERDDQLPVLIVEFAAAHKRLPTSQDHSAGSLASPRASSALRCATLRLSRARSSRQGNLSA